jgi:2,5-diketo-D-gluconate reductase A
MTPAQLILRWHVQLGNIPLCKSVTPSRIRENLAIFDFRIDADDMERIATLDGDPNGAPQSDDGSKSSAMAVVAAT